MLSVTKPGNMLMVGAPISLALVGGEEWFGYYAGVVGYAAEQEAAGVVRLTDNANDAVFSWPSKTEEIILQHMRIILIAAVALLFVGATRETPQGIPERALNFSLEPVQRGVCSVRRIVERAEAGRRG